VLDEPSSGLDPVVRRDILGAIIRTIAQEGRTVLFSSHLLDEVERVADHVALMDKGRIAFSAGLEGLKANHRCLTLRFEDARARPPALPGVLCWQGGGYEWTAFCNGGLDEFRAAASGCGGRLVAERVPSLDEIFMARVGAKCPTSAEE